MAKECIDNCPRIRTILKDVDNDNFLSGPLAFHPDSFGGVSGAERLRKACKDSYDCPGPTVQTVQKTRGLLRKTVSTDVVLFCQLDRPIK